MTPTTLSPVPAQKRTSPRHAVAIPARLTWRDQRGTTRFASAVARNVSDVGMYVECQSPIAISRFRLVQVQLERDAHDAPAALRQGRTLSAVYRVNPPSRSGQPQGLALRLMVAPVKSCDRTRQDFEAARASA